MMNLASIVNQQDCIPFQALFRVYYIFLQLVLSKIRYIVFICVICLYSFLIQFQLMNYK